MLQGFYMGVPMVFQGCFKDVSSVLRAFECWQGSKQVSRENQGCFKGVSKVLDCFRGNSSVT